MTRKASPELAGQCVRDELMALGADLVRMSPHAQRVVSAGLDVLTNDSDRPEAVAATHEGGTPREQGSG